MRAPHYRFDAGRRTRGARRSLRDRLLALRACGRRRHPLWLGIVVAAAFITGETLLVYRLRQIAPDNAFGALFLLGVLVVSAGWGFRLAVATSLASALVYVYFHLETGATLLPIHAQDAVRDRHLSAGRASGQHPRGPGPPARGRVRTTPPGGRPAAELAQCAGRTAGGAASGRDAGGARHRTIRGVSGGGGRTVPGLGVDNVAAAPLRVRRGAGAAGHP